ncbi:hypothetical protein FHETE_9261 [Fusarium heterosporum]|uniref:Uncharacterized protein n=1 Tax=Fusarium heterosporum TaxID=42747 RepID=A0A8H5SVJ9_FUSHE|nr:hypothetical protein FHETE_9261 [Fusarium heterosporum]
MSGEDEYTVGAVVRLDSPEKGDNVWTARQVGLALNLPPRDVEGRHGIDWSFGPLKITGYVDTTTLGLGISVSVAGVSIGNIYGSLKDGVGLDVDLFAAQGSLKFYLKNGNEIWVTLDLKIRFDGHYTGEHKIISF